MQGNVVIWSAAGLIIVLLIIGCIIIYLSAKRSFPYAGSIHARQAFTESSYWKVVNGTIDKSTLDYRDHKRLFRSSIRQYRPRIGYRYFAYDREYIHSTPLLAWTTDKDEAKSYLDQYKPGSSIVVRFHPKQPDTSLVELKV